MAVQPAQPQPQPAVQTQSWAAWLLDAYASTATSPITSEYPHDEEGDYYSSDTYEKTGRTADAQQQQQQQQQQQPEQRWHEDSEPSSASTFSPNSARSYDSSGLGGSAPSGSSRSVSAQQASSSAGHGYGYGYAYTSQQPYARTGRGGAGNYVWGSLGTGRASVVPESSVNENSGGGLSLSERRAAAKKLQRIETVHNGPAAGKDGGRVMSVGRGGAGNYAAKSPTAFIATTATTTTTNEGMALRSVSAPTPHSSGATGGYGRGGAGNVGKAGEDRDRKRREEREKEWMEVEKRRERIEALVDGWLLPPPTAMVGVGRRGSWAR